MTVTTIWSMTAKPTIIPWTISDFGFRINVQEWAFFIVAGVKSGVEVTLRHLGHVVFVEKLALVSLLTQPPEPVFADNGLVSPHVSEGTGGSSLTGGADVELADSRPALVHPWEGKRLGS